MDCLSAGAFESAVFKGLGSLPAGISLLAAVSGGADSTAMLASLARLRERENFTLRAAHVEHGIRPAEESRGDARAVRVLCAGLGVPCRVLSIQPGRVAEYARRGGTGIEAAARHFRYRALIKEALRRGAGAIVTAHTGDDALELCLMRILRGSGPEGLGRMPPSRRIAAGRTSLLILRPLLGLYRGDVESYLALRGLPWRRDSTNTDERFFRNRIRAGLVPFLDSRFSGWKRALETLGDTQRLAAGFISAEARSRVAWEWKDLSGRDSGRGRMLQSGGNFFDQPLIIREEALFHGLNLFRGPGSDSSIRRRSLRPFIRGKIQDIDLGFCRAAADRRGGKVSIFRRSGGGEAGFSLLIKGPGRYNLEAAAWLGSNAGEKTVLRVLERGGDPSVRLEGEGFFALLPLVLRPFRPGGARASGGAAPRDAAFAGEQGFFGTRTESVPAPRFSAALIAQDAAGEAALIGVCHRSAVILWKREIQSGGDFFFCGIGGINAEQSER